ncbi:hypothetical protein [Reyranella sp.]|uniref:hypothetical protein n=1 Tax=Reyranella sp. TaxID=1929291 RepID=UPI003BAC7603
MDGGITGAALRRGVDIDALMALVEAFEPPRNGHAAATPEEVAAAERVSRAWTSAEAGPLQPGSEAHRRAICAMFHETFNPYRPAVIDWPRLAPEELQRLTSLPIWDIAVQTEGQARLRFAAYAASLGDREMQATIMLNAWEEDRHKQVLSRLVETYGIALDKEPAYDVPRDAEWGYLLTGFSECIDSFFAFGLFDLARRSGFFPAELVETFEPVIQEECRHILFFANWLAWHRARLSPWRRLRFELRVAGVWIHIAVLRVGLARTIDRKPRNDNFTVHGAQAVSPVPMGFRELLGVCLSENDRRFAGYDARLVRPTTVPWLARQVLRLGGWRR